MKENTQEKNLIKKEKVSFFGKIKNFFAKIFKKRVKEEIEVTKINLNENNEFNEYIKKTEDEETILLELQEKYRKGEIAESDLTEEQIDALCDLYDRQIEELRKSIEIKEQKIEEYKRKNEEKNNA